jgi:PTS system nitrogen regulatory IIA component
MADELMTIREVAEYMRLNTRTVYKLAQSGELPAVRVSKQWRFRRAEVDRYLDEHSSSAAVERLASAIKSAAEAPAEVNIWKELRPEAVSLELKSENKDDMLRELAALIVPLSNKRDFDTLVRALKAREQLCSTAVSNSIAIPHSRNALVGLVEHPMLAYGRHPRGIDFGAIDGEPTRHFFLLCAPNVRLHLRLLARLSRLLMNRATVEALDAAKSPEEVIKILRDAEDALTAPTPTT